MKDVESYLVINQVKHYTIYRIKALYVTNHIYTVCLDMDNVNNKLGLYKNSYGYYMILIFFII
jgi:hypothetical protein